MMSIKLTKEELATIVNGRRILREKGLDPNMDVKTLCQEAGISRKTGYQWANENIVSDLSEKNKCLESKLKSHEEKCAAVEKEADDLKFKLDCREAAWEIHGVDDWLSKKKSVKPRKNG